MSFVLIVGGKSDMARAIAREYAARGYNLYLAGRQMGELEDFARDLRVRYDKEVIIRELDLRAFDTHAGFYEALAKKPFGVVVCAGYMGDQDEARGNWSEALNTIEVNYTGSVSLLNIIANDFEGQNEGFIIGISSVAGDRGRKTNYIYGSAKAGFTAYLSGLRNRLHTKHVQVMTVKPGFVNTRMTKGMDLPGTLTAEPGQVARDIIRAQKKGKEVLYTLGIWRYIMLIIRHIPESVFKRMSI